MTEAERGNPCIFALAFAATTFTGAFFTSTSGLGFAAAAGARITTGALTAGTLATATALANALLKGVLAGAAFLGLDLLGFMGFGGVVTQQIPE